MRRPPPGLRPRMPWPIRGLHLALYRVILLSTDRAAIHGLHPQDGACCWGCQFCTSNYAFSSPWL